MTYDPRNFKCGRGTPNNNASSVGMAIHTYQTTDSFDEVISNSSTYFPVNFGYPSVNFNIGDIIYLSIGPANDKQDIAAIINSLTDINNYLNNSLVPYLTALNFPISFQATATGPWSSGQTFIVTGYGIFNQVNLTIPKVTASAANNGLITISDFLPDPLIPSQDLHFEVYSLNPADSIADAFYNQSTNSLQINPYDTLGTGINNYGFEGFNISLTTNANTFTAGILPLTISP